MGTINSARCYQVDFSARTQDANRQMCWFDEAEALCNSQRLSSTKHGAAMTSPLSSFVSGTTANPRHAFNYLLWRCCFCDSAASICSPPPPCFLTCCYQQTIWRHRTQCRGGFLEILKYCAEVPPPANCFANVSLHRGPLFLSLWKTTHDADVCCCVEQETRNIISV